MAKEVTVMCICSSNRNQKLNYRWVCLSVQMPETHIVMRGFNISLSNHVCTFSLSLIQETFGGSETSYDNVFFNYEPLFICVIDGVSSSIFLVKSYLVNGNPIYQQPYI
eukprot:TRINITY_DN2715_c0_g1_i22.p1 TRINITY_DN2715_c0_g1~~TRINITY_DN2715_c0_g1_i22.p1  ORF type:complete len:109 (-),score=5.22 TRINITY_DN2715_c0_g1_i22:556-882(-)